MTDDSRGPCARCKHPANIHDQTPGQERCWKAHEPGGMGKPCGCPRYVDPAVGQRRPPAQSQHYPPYLVVRIAAYLVVKDRTPEQADADVVRPMHRALNAGVAEVRHALTMANSHITVESADPVEALMELMLNRELGQVVGEGGLFDPDKAARAAPGN